MYKSLGKDSFSGVGYSLLTLFAALASTSILLTNLGDELYGAWLLLLTIGSWQNLARLGFSVSLVKFISKQGNSRETLIDVTTVLIVVSTGLIALGLMAILLQDTIIYGIFGIERNTSPYLEACYGLLVLVGSFNIVSNIILATLSGLNEIFRKNSIEFTFSILTKILLIAASIQQKSLLPLAIVMCFAAGMKLMASSYVLTRHLSIKSLFSIKNFEIVSSYKKQSSFTKQIYLSSLINYFNIPFFRVFISQYFGVQYVPIYDVGIQIRDSISMVLNKLYFPFYPIFARENIQKAKETYKTLVKGNSNLVVPSLTAGLFFALPFTEIWLGSEKASTYVNAIYFISIPSLLNLMVIPTQQILLGRGLGKAYMAYNIFYAIGGSVLLVLFHATGFDFNSVYLATSISTIIAFSVILWSLNRFEINKKEILDDFSFITGFICLLGCLIISLTVQNPYVQVLGYTISFFISLIHLYSKSDSLKKLANLFKLR